MAKALIVEILADAKQFGRELDKAAGKTRSMGKVAGVAGLAIAGGLAVGLEKSVKAAMAAETSTAKLTTAFKASHDNINKYTGAIDKAESSGRNLGFSNIDIRDSLGSLEVATHNGTKAIRDLGIAEDIARFKHIDLASASKVLTMAMAGSQRATKQLGLSLQPVTTAEDKVSASFKDHSSAAYKAALASAKLADKQATAAKVIDLVSHKLHGQAQAFSDTAQGGVARMHAELEALEENLGAALLPALTAVAGVLANVTGWLAKHTTVAKIAVIAVGALAVALMAMSVATTIAAAATAGLALPILAVVAALAVLGVAVYEVIKHWGAITAFFGEVWGKIKGVFTAGIGFVKEHWRAFAVALATIIAGPMAGLIVFLASHWRTIKSGAVTAWNEIKSAVIRIVNAFKDSLLSVLHAAASVAKGVWDGIKGAWSSAWHALESAVVGPIKTIISWIRKLLGWIARIPSHIHMPGTGHGGGGFSIPIPTPGGIPIPGLASGGIVTSPTLAVVGESGPEAVIPLDRMGGGGVTVNVGPVYGTVDAGFAQRLSREIATQLRVGRAPQLQQAIQAI